MSELGQGMATAGISVLQPTSGNNFTASDVKGWRIKIDGLIDASDQEFISSREISLAKTSLQRAKAWLGETLKAIGTENPYPNSSNPENKIIEPQAEHGHDRETFARFETQLERVKAIRGSIHELTDSIQKLQYGLGYEQKFISLQNLIEAKHWFGWELDRIRNEQEANEVAIKNLPTSLY